MFEEPWWLDAVAPGAWGAVVVERKGNVVGRLPYVVRKSRGLSRLVQPPLTPVLGPWVDAGSGARPRQISNHHEILGELIDSLPPVHAHFQQFTPDLENASPFFWRGYTLTPRYSYRITDLSDLDAVLAGMNSATRRNLRKAQEEYTVHADRGFEVLVDLAGQSMARSGGEPYDKQLLSRLENAAGSRGQGRLLVAEDESGKACAAAYYVWDERCLYYLIGGQASDARGGNAPSLLMWEAIRHAAEVSSAFDFEGSMIPEIERFFRGFGGTPTLYFDGRRVARWLSPLLELRTSIRPGGD